MPRSGSLNSILFKTARTVDDIETLASGNLFYSKLGEITWSETVTV